MKYMNEIEIYEWKLYDNKLIIKAVRASMSILDYLPPMYYDKSLLIDGGYTNNLPVDVMKDVFNPKLNVAVDVENKDGDNFDKIPDYGDYLSGKYDHFFKLFKLKK